MALKPCKDIGEQVHAKGRRSLRIETSKGAVAALVIAALGFPIASMAQPPGTAARVGAQGPSIRGDIGAPEGGNIVMHRLKTKQWTPTGWALFATAGGRSMDLSTLKGWAEDPNAGPRELAAGLGWRGRNVSAMMGYTRPDFGARVDNPHGARPQGLMGISIELRSR
jgi:hypothetical protein